MSPTRTCNRASWKNTRLLRRLRNLLTFPFIRSRVDEGVLSIHGLWTDIGEGGLEHYDHESGMFLRGLTASGFTNSK